MPKKPDYMIESTDLLSQFFIPMDLLSDLFRQAGVRRRLFGAEVLPPGQERAFPCERSIGFHVVSRGEALLRVEGGDTTLRLGAGDVAVMARGCHHQLCGGQRTTTGADAQVLSAAYQLWNSPLHPFFGEVPDWLVLRMEERPRLGAISLLVELMGAELAAPVEGSESVLNGLMDAAFSYLLREVLERGAGKGPGFGRALRSPAVRRALHLMHERLAEDWTLERLAREVALSRTALAVKFREALAETPMGYLRRLRMQRASQRLVDTDLPLEHIASEVGYQDAFGFSRVFKKTLGQSPREFRRREAADPMAELRFRTPLAE